MIDPLPHNERDPDRSRANLLITVITVCLNNEATIEETLRSVAAQTHPGGVEHIIVDGGSDDRTMEIVGRYAHVARLISEKDGGIYDAMNKGLARATGEIVGTLNADDFYARSDVLAMVAEAFSDPVVGVCYADLCYVRRHDPSRTVRYWRSSDFQPDLCLRGWSPAHPTFFVRKSVYDNFGTFDLSYKLAADDELMLRLLAKHRVKSRYIPYVLVKMRLGGATNNSVLNIVKQNVEVWRALKSVDLKPSALRFIVGKMVNRGRQFFVRPGAK